MFLRWFMSKRCLIDVKSYISLKFKNINYLTPTRICQRKNTSSCNILCKSNYASNIKSATITYCRFWYFKDKILRQYWLWHISEIPYKISTSNNIIKNNEGQELNFLNCKTSCLKVKKLIYITQKLQNQRLHSFKC